MFFAVFGGLWLELWASDQYRGSILAVLIVAVLAAALLAAAIRVYQRHSGALKALAQTPETRRRSRYFNLINGAQWIAIFVVAFTLAKTGLGTWILPSIILIVGLHFLPLARLFGYRPHYVTGAALILLAIAYPRLADDGPASALGALATGVILWLSAIVAISPSSHDAQRAASYLDAAKPASMKNSGVDQAGRDDAGDA
jgi:hypothetical protein